MMQTGPREGEVRAANEIFTLLSERHNLAVIIDALASRDGLSDEARSLSTRIRKLRIKGFRDANRAPHDRLVETILEAIAEGDHGLAAAILGAWMQTHSALRERAAAHLRERGIDVVDAPPVRFTSCWDTDEWLLERNRMLQDSDGAHHAHRDDAALMLSLLSGRFPGPPPVESELFKTWIDTLWDLPASAPEWPDDAANLGKWIRYILREKERELIEGVVRKIASQWDGIKNEFNDDLRLPGDRPADVAGPARRTGGSDRHAQVPDRAAGAAGGVPAVAAAGGLAAGRD